MVRRAISDEKQRRRQHWAWYMYDFGNSAYAAVVLLAVYATYFKKLQEFGYRGDAVVEVSAMIFNRPEYDPKEAARKSYAALVAGLEKAGLARGK